MKLTAEIMSASGNQFCLMFHQTQGQHTLYVPSSVLEPGEVLKVGDVVNVTVTKRPVEVREQAPAAEERVAVAAVPDHPLGPTEPVPEVASTQKPAPATIPATETKEPTKL